ncbi:TrbM/KikA/MpfK family conjugal transfer protein [Neisseriaceae bacterium B1]
MDFEATLLCLSSGDRPDECKPSLDKYFSIHHRKMKDTIRARRDFLRQCPASNESGMQDLTSVLAEGAGRCNAKELNRVMKRQYQKKVCNNPPSIYARNKLGNESNCHFVTSFYISKDKPSYCSRYFNHEWTTAESKVRFVGTEKEGGKWVDVK